MFYSLMLCCCRVFRIRVDASVGRCLGMLCSLITLLLTVLLPHAGALGGCWYRRRGQTPRIGGLR